MKVKTIALLPGIAAVLVVAAALLVVAPNRAHAAAKPSTTKSQSKTSSKSTSTKKTQKSTKSNTAPVSYTYVAQPGDSYTLFARKAVETYAQQQKLNLSQNRIIYAETNLTIAAGSPYLNLGQEESLSSATVKTWVTNALNLSDAQAALWDVYVPTVNFDVSNVGQAS